MSLGCTAASPWGSQAFRFQTNQPLRKAPDFFIRCGVRKPGMGHETYWNLTCRWLNKDRFFYFRPSDCFIMAQQVIHVLGMFGHSWWTHCMVPGEWFDSASCLMSFSRRVMLAVPVGDCPAVEIAQGFFGDRLEHRHGSHFRLYIGHYWFRLQVIVCIVPI